MTKVESQFKKELLEPGEKKLTPLDLWQFHVTNQLVIYVQEELGKHDNRKKILDAKKGQEFHCPKNNVVDFKNNENFSKTIKDMQKACEKNMYNFFTLRAPTTGNDVSSHYIGYVQYKKTVYLMDPANENQWGEEIKKWINKLNSIWDTEYGFKVETYTAINKPQSYEIDTFCQTWSLFLQCQFMDNTWEYMNNTEYDLFDDLIPFINNSMKKIGNKNEDVQNIVLEGLENKAQTKVYDQVYVYYTLKSKMTILDFCETMLNRRNLSNTTYYIMPALGNGIDLDDDEIKFLEKGPHPLIKNQKFMDTLGPLEILQKEQAKIQKDLKSKEKIGGGQCTEETYFIYDLIGQLFFSHREKL